MKNWLLIIFLFPVLQLASQQKDSVFHLREVEISVYRPGQTILQSPASIAIIKNTVIGKTSANSFIPSFNTVPGVRMEERSPGSYRLSLRGSLLRSPFGIRNVKIYIDEFPFTDAGGNTYLNSIDPGLFSTIEIIKGPDGSQYGANTGGIVILHPGSPENDTTLINFSTQGGNFNSVSQKIKLTKSWKKNSIDFAHGYQSSAGFRENSAMKRNYMHFSQGKKYSGSGELKIFFLCSNLEYETPGGLTQSQETHNPRQARPAKGIFPGAAEQKAGVKNRTIFSGISNEITFKKKLKYKTTLSGSLTDFRNPFITNYETRKENSGSLRSWLEVPLEKRFLTIKGGYEGGFSFSEINNFENNKGLKGSLQSGDELQIFQSFFFVQVTLKKNRILAEAAGGINNYSYKFRHLFPYDETANTVRSGPSLMPRLAVSYRVNGNTFLRGCVSRGFSPPTLHEIRPSDQQVHSGLSAESGYNFEAGIRKRDRKDRFMADASLFHFRLDQAIVKRINEQEQEFFINSGGTNQTGIETLLTIRLLAGDRGKQNPLLELSAGYTLSKFHFRNYTLNEMDYSGNRLTGVPENILETNLNLVLKSFYLFSQFYVTGPIPLNDSNTVYSEPSDVFNIQSGITKPLKRKGEITVFAGSENLFRESYSIGYDLNAPGDRYFNPAGWSYYFGIRIGR